MCTHSWLSLTCDSTLAISGGVAGGLHQGNEELGWRISQQRGAGRGWRILVGEVRPELSADGGERVAEGGFGLGYQAVCRVGRRSGCAAWAMRTMTLRGRGGGAWCGRRRGWSTGAGSPGRDAPGFLEGDFDVPSLEVGGQDGRGIDRLVGAKSA